MDTYTSSYKNTAPLLDGAAPMGPGIAAHPHGLHSKHVYRRGETHSADLGSVTPLQGSTIFNSKSATISRTKNKKPIVSTKLDSLQNDDFKHPQMTKSPYTSDRSSPLQKYRKRSMEAVRSASAGSPQSEPTAKRLLSLKGKIPKMSPPRHEELDFDAFSSPTNPQGRIPDPIEFEPTLTEEDVTRTNVTEFQTSPRRSSNPLSETIQRVRNSLSPVTKEEYLSSSDKENKQVEDRIDVDVDVSVQSVHSEIRYDKEVLAASQHIDTTEQDVEQENSVMEHNAHHESNEFVLSPITKDVYDFDSPVAEVKAPSVDRSEEFMTALENKVANDQKLKETVTMLQEQVAYDVGISKHLLDNFQFMTDYYSIQMKGKSDTIARLEQTTTTLQEQMAEKDEYIDTLIDSKERMQATIDSKNLQITELLAAEEKILEKNTHAYSELSEKSERIADLEAKVMKLESKVEDLDSALHQKEEALVGASKRADFLHLQNVELSNDAKNAENLKREVEALENNNKRIEHFLHSEYSKKLAQRIQARETTWNEKVSSLQTKYERSQLEVKRLMQMLNASKGNPKQR